MGFGIDMAKAREIHKTNIEKQENQNLQNLILNFKKHKKLVLVLTEIVAKKQAQEMHLLILDILC